MTREEWIKMRDRAATQVAEIADEMHSNDLNRPEYESLMEFHTHIHEVACRELALIPIPISCEFDLAKVENAIDEIRMWRQGTNSATTAINNIESLLRSAVAKGGSS